MQYMKNSLSRTENYVLFFPVKMPFFWNINEIPNLHNFRNENTQFFPKKTHELFFHFYIAHFIQGRNTITEITVHSGGHSGHFQEGRQWVP